jgi:putative acetyltransferase
MHDSADPADRDALADLWVASWRAIMPAIDFPARRPWLLERLDALEATGSRTICTRDANGRPLGFATFDPVTGWLDQIVVAPAAFGTGIGAALLAVVKAQCPSGVSLDVNTDNPRAIGFYRREGFRRVGSGVNALSGLSTVAMRWDPAGAIDASEPAL